MTEEPRGRWSISPQAIVGLAIVFFGLLLTAGNLGYGNFGRAIRFWPMVFTAAGVAILLERGQSSGRRMWGTILVVGGLWQTGNTAFGMGIYIDDWWPLLIVGAGVLLVMRALKPAQPNDPGASDLPGSTPGVTGSTSATVGAGGHEDVVTAFAFMSGVRRNISSTSFRRASLTAIMGGVEIDFRQSAASGGESVVEVFAMWGGIELRVPPDWQVVNNVVPIMGGVDDRSGHTQPYRHRLVLKGVVLMGGVEVKS